MTDLGNPVNEMVHIRRKDVEGKWGENNTGKIPGQIVWRSWFRSQFDEELTGFRF